MKYKLLALDVDGTLLNDEYEITNETKREIRKLSKLGVNIVLCTGRGPSNTLPVMAELGLDGTMITHNGAATVLTNGQILHQYCFPIEEMLPLIEYCRTIGIHFDACTPFEMHIENMDEKARLMYGKYKIQPILLSDITQMKQPLVKFTLFGSMKEMDRVEADWTNWKANDSPYRIIRSGDYFIDAMDAQASKGNALRNLALQWAIDPSQIIAIGNYYNDLDMLEFAGLGIAMDNSPDEVKRQADRITASNNDNGVYKALRQYFH